MKALKILQGLVLLMTSSYLQAQKPTFAETGTIWYYNYGTELCPPFNYACKDGYMKILSEKDTMIEGKACHKLAVSLNVYSNIDGNTSEIQVQKDPRYVCNIADSVFEYVEGKFYLMYLFNVDEGGFWIVEDYPGEFEPCNEGFGVDYPLETININGTELSMMPMVVGSMDLASFVNIIDQIGPSNTPFPDCRFIAPHTGPSSLRGFISPNGLFYSQDGHTPENVEILNKCTGINEIGGFTPGLIGAIAREELFIYQTLPEKSEIVIYTADGRKVLSANPSVSGNTSSMDVTNLEQGTYLCQINGKVSGRFIKL